MTTKSKKVKDSKVKTKMTSRKFMVWIVSTLLMVLFCFLFKNDSQVVITFIPFWGGISMVYIGGNALCKYIDVKKENTSE